VRARPRGIVGALQRGGAAENAFTCGVLSTGAGTTTTVILYKCIFYIYRLPKTSEFLSRGGVRPRSTAARTTAVARTRCFGWAPRVRVYNIIIIIMLRVPYIPIHVHSILFCSSSQLPFAVLLQRGGRIPTGDLLSQVRGVRVRAWERACVRDGSLPAPLRCRRFYFVCNCRPQHHRHAAPSTLPSDKNRVLLAIKSLKTRVSFNIVLLWSIYKLWCDISVLCSIAAAAPSRRRVHHICFIACSILLCGKTILFYTNFNIINHLIPINQ